MITAQMKRGSTSRLHTRTEEDQMTDGTILVLGGTGKTGARVAERLLARGLPVRIGSRSGDPAFDWDDPATWGPALEGVGVGLRVLLPRPRHPRRPDGRRGALGRRRRARRARGWCCCPGAARRRPSAPSRRVHGLGPGVDGRALQLVQPELQRGRLRSSCVRDGELALPAGDVPEPFVDAEDIADVAVAALTEDGHAGRGLRAHRAAPADLRRGGGGDRRGAAGRRSGCVPISHEEFAAGLDEAEVRRRRSSGC